MDKKYLKPTQKQLDFIADMEELGCGEFKGKTRKEASDYISKHIECYKLLQEDSWTLQYN